LPCTLKISPWKKKACLMSCSFFLSTPFYRRCKDTFKRFFSSLPAGGHRHYYLPVLFYLRPEIYIGNECQHHNQCVPALRRHPRKPFRIREVSAKKALGDHNRLLRRLHPHNASLKAAIRGEIRWREGSDKNRSTFYVQRSRLKLIRFTTYGCILSLYRPKGYDLGYKP